MSLEFGNAALSLLVVGLSLFASLTSSPPRAVKVGLPALEDDRRCLRVRNGASPMYLRPQTKFAQKDRACDSQRVLCARSRNNSGKKSRLSESTQRSIHKHKAQQQIAILDQRLCAGCFKTLIKGKRVPAVPASVEHQASRRRKRKILSTTSMQFVLM
jgi:hypothetical protein